MPRKKPSLNKLNTYAALWYCKKENLWWISYPNTLYDEGKWPFESEALVYGDTEFRPSSYTKEEFLKMRDTKFIEWLY